MTSLLRAEAAGATAIADAIAVEPQTTIFPEPDEETFLKASRLAHPLTFLVHTFLEDAVRDKGNMTECSVDVMRYYTMSIERKEVVNLRKRENVVHS